MLTVTVPTSKIIILLSEFIQFEKLNAGFTLIELLVVVGIIGILLPLG